MDIPYTVKDRPDTGLYNGKLGIWLFLASEVMLFGGLFSAYVFLRTGAESWPTGADILNVPLATLNTLFLITSSVTMVMSWASLKLKEFDKFKLYAGLTLLLAASFLVVKYFEYTAKFHHGLFPWRLRRLLDRAEDSLPLRRHSQLGSGADRWAELREDAQEYDLHLHDR